MKPINDEILYTFALSQIKGVGPIIARQLLDQFGSAQTLFRENPTVLSTIPRIGNQLAEAVRSCSLLDQAEREMDFVSKHQIEVLTLGSPNYPTLLSECPDAPVLLFYKGSCSLNAKKILSIVGTRSATPYGLDLTHHFIEEIARTLPDTLIVSGLAYGIDVCAHREALKSKLNTIGILAHGLDRIYPISHRQIAKEMISHGGLLSEYPIHTTPERSNFLARNRIIAGISQATIVVETALKGGAMVTASIANSYAREVFTFPGRVQDQRSQGCNKLIQKNMASLIQNATDFLSFMNWESDTKKEIPIQQKIAFDLDENETRIIEKIKEKGEIQLNTLSVATNLPIHILTGILIDLELKQIVSCFPGAIYRLSPKC